MNSVDFDNFFVFNPKNSRIKHLCLSLLCPCIDFEYGNALLEFGCFTGSTMSSEMLVLLSTQAQPVLSSQEYVFA